MCSNFRSLLFFQTRPSVRSVMTDSTPHLVLVEDEPDVASFIQKGLQEENYNVQWVPTGRRALEVIPQSPVDLVLLDVRLPDIDGLEVCERLRVLTSDLPIMMLTALDAVEDRVAGLRSGADDYLPKPFAFDELLARIEALLRRARRSETPPPLDDGPLHLNPAARTCRVGTKEVDLTPTEFDLLAYLAARPGQALSRDAIHRDVWGHAFDRGTNLIDVYVNYVRRKLEAVGLPSTIETVRGIGYRYTSVDEAAASSSAET